MRLLIDTDVLLWAAGAPDRLPPSFRDALESPENDVLFSPASIWEVTIKTQIGRLELGISPEELASTATQQGFQELAVTAAHAASVLKLPLHHRDPFDRILIAQAIVEPARFLTVDRALVRYSPLVELAQ